MKQCSLRSFVFFWEGGVPPLFLINSTVSHGVLVHYRNSGSYLFNTKLMFSGTHWWHSHAGMHRSDGLAGALVIKRSKEENPHSNLYDIGEAEFHCLFIHYVFPLCTLFFLKFLAGEGANPKFTTLFPLI